LTPRASEAGRRGKVMSRGKRTSLRTTREQRRGRGNVRRRKRSKSSCRITMRLFRLKRQRAL
jgi:hypothetical protein